MRLKLISCEVLLREMCAAVARSPHQVDVEFISKGLHDLGAKAMRARLQTCIDAARGYDAVLMGYALCGNGLIGIEAREAPVVVPRAHDCIALLMGSRERYETYFNENPGVYFRSTGWLERGRDLHQIAQRRLGAGSTLDELIERYGEDNGRYLFEELNRYQQQYRQLTFIETGLEPDSCFHDQARREAEMRGWSFEIYPGNLRLIVQLVAGDWSGEDFLVVPPGHRLRASFDAGIIAAERISS